MEIYYPGGQEIVFLYSVFVGAGLGALYDVFKIKREFFGTSKAVLFADDLLFMLTSAVILIFGVFKINSGNLRWYEFLCPGLGFVAYRMTLSRLVIAFFCFISRKLKQLIRFVARMIKAALLPFVKLFVKLFAGFAKRLDLFAFGYYTKIKKNMLIKKCKEIV